MSINHYKQSEINQIENTFNICENTATKAPWHIYKMISEKIFAQNNKKEAYKRILFSYLAVSSLLLFLE